MHISQIRKMVGLALCVLHGSVPEGVMDIAISSPFRVHVPLAPGYHNTVHPMGWFRLVGSLIL